MSGDGDLLHLSTGDRTAGPAVHVNQPLHAGDTPLHDHDFLEFAVVLAGHGVHRTVHGERPVAAGDVLVLHPGQWHAYEQCRNLRLGNCCLGMSLLAGELAWTLRDPQIGPLLPGRRGDAGQHALHLRLPAEATARIDGELGHLRRLLTGPTPALDRAEILGRVILVLGGIARWGQGLATTKTPTAAVPEHLQELLAAMEDDLAHPWGLEELARRSGQSRFHLAHQFRRHVGRPPMAWLLGRRAERAAVLLLTSRLPIAEIGRQVGWADANFFARRFRAVFQQSPSAYRQMLPVPPQVRQGEDWVQW